MIVRRKSPKVLYWVSEDPNLGETEIFPKVPQNFLTQGKAIDSKTKRIQLFDSLDDAISVYGIGKKDLRGLVLCVYRPRFIPPDNRVPADINNCPYYNILDGTEYWCQYPLEMLKMAEIKIGDIEKELEYKWGNRALKQSFSRVEKLRKYSWEEILPPWDKKGKTRKL